MSAIQVVLTGKLYSFPNAQVEAIWFRHGFIRDESISTDNDRVVL